MHYLVLPAFILPYIEVCCFYNRQYWSRNRPRIGLRAIKGKGSVANRQLLAHIQFKSEYMCRSNTLQYISNTVVHLVLFINRHLCDQGTPGGISSVDTVLSGAAQSVSQGRECVNILFLLSVANTLEVPLKFERWWFSTVFFLDVNWSLLREMYM